MLLVVALLIYLLAVILTFIFAYRNGIRKWSALILGLIVGFVVLNIAISPNVVLTAYDGSFLPLLYLIIEILTPLIIIIYVVVMILNDNCSCSDIQDY